MSDKIKVHCAHDKMVALEALKPNPANPNKHPDAQIALLAKIIRAQGWRNPIVVSKRSGLITKGHARLIAAKLLGVATAPVDFQDYSSEAQELADMIADNRIAELAEADRTMLRELAEQLDTGDFDMDLTGFDELSLRQLLEAMPSLNGENDPNAEWQGMPEFMNDPRAFRTLIVHFKTPRDLADFLKRLEQTITDQTKFIWHPAAVRRDLKNIAFVSEK